jgi:hypothetical protein
VSRAEDRAMIEPHPFAALEPFDDAAHVCLE